MNRQNASNSVSEKTVKMSKTELDRTLAAAKQSQCCIIRAERFQILRQDWKGESRLVIVVGSLLNYQEMEHLKEEVARLLVKPVTHWKVDFTELKYCDSAMLGMCIAIKSMMYRNGCEISIHLVRNSQVHDAFRITQLDQTFTLVFAQVAQKIGLKV